MIIQNAIIFTMAGPVIQHGYIQLQNGIIQSVGPMSDCPSGTDRVLEARGCYALPGFVDAHSHIGLFEDSLSFEGEDGNEDTDPATPNLRAIDGVNPMERSFSEALNAGVTTVVVSPGSANPIGGSVVAMKTSGVRVDDMIIRNPVAIKFALGENPKSVYREKGQAPITRMGTAALIREYLFKTKEYLERQERAAADEEVDAPEYDAKLSALVPLLKGTIPAHFHAHRADDIFTAIRISKEFHLDYVIIHGTESHLIADILQKERAKIICGPMMTDRSKPELSNLSIHTPGMLFRSGVDCAICTDHPETPEKYFLDCALAAVKGGLSESEALAAITIKGAEIAGISDRVGSIVPGKDGDIVLFDGNPFDYKSKIRSVFVDGEKVKDGAL